MSIEYGRVADAFMISDSTAIGVPGWIFEIPERRNYWLVRYLSRRPLQ
jgi:hypothetical protein